MEFSTSRLPLHPPRVTLISPKISSSSSSSSFTSTTKIYPSSFTISTSFSRNPHLPLTRFRISARFGRPTKRQNHLRKKLTHHQLDKVCNLPTPLLQFDDASDSNVDNTENIEKRPSLDDEIINLATSSDNVKELGIQLPKKPSGESINWNKLESWVHQYKKDSDFWGVGTGTIFNITQDSEGKVEKVMVDDGEILRRSRVDLELDGQPDDDEFQKAKLKISIAHGMARDMESGSDVIPKNSTVAKFSSSVAEHSELRDTTQSVRLKTGLFSRMSRVGLLLLFGTLVVRQLFATGGSKTGATTEKQQILKGNVEVVDDPIEIKSVSSKRPRLNKEELFNSINQLKERTNVLGSGYDSKQLENKIAEIKKMARNAREVEKRNALDDGELEDDKELEDELTLSSGTDLESIGGNSSGTIELASVSALDDNTGQFSGALSGENDVQICDTSTGIPISVAGVGNDDNYMSSVDKSSDLNVPNVISDCPASDPNNSHRKKFRIMKSVEEAQEYLSKKHPSQMVNGGEQTDIPMSASIENVTFADFGDMLDVTENNLHGTSGSNDPLYPITTQFTGNNISEEYLGTPNDLEKPVGTSDHDVHTRNKQNGIFMHERHVQEVDKKTSEEEDHEEKERLTSSQLPGGTTEQAHSVNKENWIEKNFHEFEPIVERIRAGFQDNYNVARQKANNNLDPMMEFNSDDGGESEYEWMKDEKLSEIVFKVRDNELLGRDPFHNMNEDDKRLFFGGLEKKVEQVNEKLRGLHEYFHSNIENIDYGAEGISLYDPPEKIVPRWKVPPAEKNPEFLDNFLEQRKAFVAEGLKNSVSTKKTGNVSVDKSEENSYSEKTNLVADKSVNNGKGQGDPALSSKTVIQSSDGSTKAGKKSGKEFWQHTKKWSKGFLESYNAETDPEVKSVMKDIGKDLDRWITEKEIQEAAELMDKLPERRQKLVKEKLDKVKREVELFGPQAVVSKYREYAEEKEEDHLWWLDLPYVMCIELYTVEDGEQRVGFYSLEMAVDLELDPKQYHVIAFEDARDCKNLCYIIQAHMELLGNGNAFVVARPPKDAFREAKENGFSVTVIRNSQLQLNIDQTLEEVEELIQEIGSKIYHDKLMKERSMDVNALMKGVFGVSNPTKRKKRSKRIPKRGNKS